MDLRACRAANVLQKKRECVGEERCWIIAAAAAAAKDVHNVLVAIYSEA